MAENIESSKKESNVEYKPEYIKDANKLCGDIILWTWNKYHTEDTLSLREQACELSELVLKSNPENVESDEHVQIGVKTVDLRQEYMSLVNKSLSRISDENSFLRQKTTDIMVEMQDELDKTIRYQEVLVKANQGDPLVAEACSILKNTGFSSPEQIKEFGKHMTDLMKGKKTGASADISFNTIYETLRRLRTAMSALPMLDKIEERIGKQDEDSKKEYRDASEVIKLEKDSSSIHEQIIKALDLRNRQVNVELSNDVEEKESKNVLNTVNQWLRNAESGESLRLSRDFLSKKEPYGKKRLKKGSDVAVGASYGDVAIIRVDRQGENYNIFVSEMLGVRTYAANDAFRLKSALMAISEALKDLDEKMEFVGPKQKDERMEQVWKDYSHIDSEYRQLQLSFKDLSKEKAEFVILNLLAELSKMENVK